MLFQLNHQHFMVRSNFLVEFPTKLMVTSSLFQTNGYISWKKTFRLKCFTETIMKQSSGWWFGTFFIFPCFPYIGNNIPNWLMVFMNPVMVTSRKMFHWNCPIFRISQHVSALATRLVGVFGHAHAFPQCAGPPVRKSSLWCGDGMGFSRPHFFNVLCWVCCLKMWNINENPPFCFYGMVYTQFFGHTS